MGHIVIIPLAGFNDEHRELSLLTIQRLKRCVQLAGLHGQRRVDIVLSGGYGQHFNPSDQPHYLIQEKYLSEHLNWSQCAIGRGATGLLTGITNTVEEAIALYNELVCPNSIFHSADEIIVVTSPFHFERSKYLMETAHSKAPRNKLPKLTMEVCDPVPTRDDADPDDISFLDPTVPKIRQNCLYRNFMTGLSDKQKHALDKYEEVGLQTLKTCPYGSWLEFVESK